MADQVSFTKHEHEIVPGFREKINHAESTEDVKKFFFQTGRKLLQRVFQELPTLGPEDITLRPGRKPGYHLSPRLQGLPGFRTLWQHSDLPHVLARLAESARRRYRHLEKSPAKTDAKIRR